MTPRPGGSVDGTRSHGLVVGWETTTASEPTMSHSTNVSRASYSQLAGIPNVDLSENLRAALAAGKRATGIAAEVLALRTGPGKLTPQEYFYYRLWDAPREGANKQRFVGKIAQHPMHVA